MRRGETDTGKRRGRVNGGDRIGSPGGTVDTRPRGSDSARLTACGVWPSVGIFALRLRSTTTTEAT